MTSTSTTPLLADWGERFSCYTAALATWIAQGESQWWRPLLAGGPELAVTRQDSGTWRFDHSPRPWGPTLGLGVRSAAAWPEARDGLAADLETGPVILAADVFTLPWQLESGTRHAPHWVTMYRDGDNVVVDDPLIMLTEAGPQQPYLGTFALDDLAAIGTALPAGDEVLWLRERSVIGTSDPAEGATYRWLAPAPAADRAAADRPYDDPGRLTGPDALHALADDLDALGAETSAVLRHVDDLWQALRVRELAAAAAEQDPEFFAADAAEAERRLEALAVWRDMPVLLHHSRIKAATGNPRAAAGVVEALRELADLEPRAEKEEN